MADMVGASRLSCKLNISFNLSPLALTTDSPVIMLFCINAVMDVTAVQKLVHLAVSDDWLAEGFGLKHSFAHQLAILNTLAVIREGDYERRHFLELRKNLAFLADAYGAVRIDLDAGAFLYAFELNLKVLCAVGNGLQIRHGAYRCIPSVSPCRTSCRNRLFIRKTRLSEMHMQVTKGG